MSYAWCQVSAKGEFKLWKIRCELCIWSRNSSKQPQGSNRPHPEEAAMAEGSSLRKESNDVTIFESVFAHFFILYLRTDLRLRPQVVKHPKLFPPSSSGLQADLGSSMAAWPSFPSLDSSSTLITLISPWWLIVFVFSPFAPCSAPLLYSIAVSKTTSQKGIVCERRKKNSTDGKLKKKSPTKMRYFWHVEFCNKIA